MRYVLWVVDIASSYSVYNQNNMNFLISMLLVFTNMCSIAMVTMLFSCN